jgi:ribonuclease G
MDKIILMSETAKETRIAIQENGELVELFVEKPEQSRTVGNIYKGKVENVVEGIQATFVDIGHSLNAFLPFSEMNNPDSPGTIIEDISRDEEEDEEEEPSYKPRKKRKAPPAEINLKAGQEVLVQVIKEPFGKKGPRVTTDISIPGRFLVLVPNAEYIGISKKIMQRNEKRRLRQIAVSIKPKRFGLIIRTVAKGQDKKTLQADLKQLLENWRELRRDVRNRPAPVCVYYDMGTASSVIRDLLAPDVSKIIVDTKSLYKRLHNYIRTVSPEFTNRLEYYHSRKPLFMHYNVEKEFERSLNKKVWLKSGGFIVIEHTEAMTPIDVNSGKYIGKKGHEENALRINLEAAREIARQVRLRDIGGLIVIDFIDMEESEHKRMVFNEFRKELRADRAKLALSPISDFGLLEMTRQRIRLNLLYSVSEECPLCHGTGRITSKESLVTKIESWFRRFKLSARERRLTLHVHPEIANYLKESTGNLLRKVQWKNMLWIKMVADNTINVDEFRVYSGKTGDNLTDKY